MKKLIYSVFLLLLSNVIFCQSENYKGKAYNGTDWNKMFINSKYNYLTSILERRKYPWKSNISINDDNCKMILNDIADGQIRIDASLEDIVNYLNTFYSSSKNVNIPIVNAYCTIVLNIYNFNQPFKPSVIDSLRILFPKTEAP